MPRTRVIASSTRSSPSPPHAPSLLPPYRYLPLPRRQSRVEAVGVCVSWADGEGHRRFGKRVGFRQHRRQQRVFAHITAKELRGDAGSLLHWVWG